MKKTLRFIPLLKVFLLALIITNTAFCPKLKMLRLVPINSYVNDVDTPLTLAIRQNNIEDIKALVKGKTSLNTPTNDGYTPLSLAVWKEDEKSSIAESIVTILIKAGADVNLPNTIDHDEFNQTTPLMLATYSSSCNLAKILIRSGANVNAKSPYGYTALSKAIDRKNEQMVQLLLENGAAASINVKDSSGAPPLIYAVIHNLSNTVEKLIAAGADIDVQCRLVGTPLILATKLKLPSMVQLLLDKGADKTVPYQNKTALDYAKEELHEARAFEDSTAEAKINSIIELLDEPQQSYNQPTLNPTESIIDTLL